MGEGLVLRNVLAQHLEQFLVEHHDQGVDIGLQFGQAVIGVGGAARAFKLKRLGHHTHRQDAHFLGDAGDHRRCASARAAAHARCDEQHVRAVNGRTDLVGRRLCGLATLVGPAAGAQTGAAELNDFFSAHPVQGLRIGVGANEFHALYLGHDHVLDRVATAPAHADHLDLRALVEFLDIHHFDAHESLLLSCSCLECEPFLLRCMDVIVMRAGRHLLRGSGR